MVINNPYPHFQPMKQCQRPIVNPAMSDFQISQQIAGTICPINIYKKTSGVKYYSRTLSRKIYVFLLWVVWRLDIFYPPNSIIALFNYVIQIHPISESPRKILRYTHPQLKLQAISLLK